MLKMENCKIRFESLPSLRGDVNKVDRGELKAIIEYKFKKKNLSTPSSAKADTSPQSREGLKFLPSLRGECPKGKRGAKKQYKETKI